jgi:capsular exopolysaccharide synthesis family protein
MVEELGSRPVDLRVIGGVIRRRRWLLIVPWSVAVLGGIAGAFLLPPVYESSVTLMLERPQQLPGNLSGVGSGPNPDAQADLMREQVRSSLFLRSVIAATDLRSDPATRAEALKAAGRYPGTTGDELVVSFLTDRLREAITIRLGKGNVFQVTVADFRPGRAFKLVQAVSQQFVASSRAAQLEAARRSQEFSSEQQQIYKGKLEESEGRLEAFRRSVLSTTVVGSTVNVANVGRARTQLEQSQLEADDLRQRVGGLRQQLAGRVRDSDFRALSTAEVSNITAQMATLERQLAGATLSDPLGNQLGSFQLSIVRKHGDLATELSIAAAKVAPAEVRELLVDCRLAQADLAGVEARRDWLARQISTYERNVVMAPDQEIHLQRLSQEVENNRAYYISFLQQFSAAQIAEAFENAKLSGRFVILEPARQPNVPARPNRPVLILLAILAGGVIGAGTVMVVEHHDESVKNADEVESLLGLPVLGTLPRVAELEVRRRRPGTFANAPGGVPAQRDQGMLHRLKVESALGLEFRRIFLKLARTRGRQLPHTLVVTSATRGEGKTTTTACLAITLARELRQKVLLVDFDLRSPSLHRALGLPSSSWGLAQILGQRHFDERFVRATVLPNLEFLPAGKSDRPAAELIESEVVEWFVKEAASRYPMVIIDCAPNLAVPDPLILGRAVEGVLYVVKAGSTVRKAAEYGVKVQREARDNVLGVLINDAGEILPQYYGYRYRSYGDSDEAAGADS